MDTLSASLQRIHILVTGRVQNVGFRAYVLQTGNHLGLTGWVRNIGRDQVETIAEGPRPALEQFSHSVREGPIGSRVEQAEETWESATGEFKGFQVRNSR